MYQESSGMDNWDDHTSYGSRTSSWVTFRGYKILENTTSLEQGNHPSPGFIAMENSAGSAGMMAGIRDLWQQYPKEIILGETEDPLLPQDLDIVFIVNAFHDIRRQVPLLNNLATSLKPGAPVVIIDRDPIKINNFSGHVLTQEELLEKIEESVFELDRIETFLPQHNIYIIRRAIRDHGNARFVLRAVGNGGPNGAKR